MSSPFGPRKKPDPDQDLATTIDQILGADPEFKRLSRRILRAQRRLKRLCSPETWQRYLVVEQITNERYERVSRLLLKYGLAGREMKAKL
jgi:hypothetical protein